VRIDIAALSLGTLITCLTRVYLGFEPNQNVGVDSMPRKKESKKRQSKDKAVGIEAVVKPGYEALYIRGAWMKKLDNMGKRERKQFEKGKGKPK